MNHFNFHALQDYLQFHGFGEQPGFTQELERLVAEDAPTFYLPVATSFDGFTKIEAMLYFRRSPEENGYFLNRYTASLFFPDEPERNRSQTFTAMKMEELLLKRPIIY